MDQFLQQIRECEKVIEEVVASREQVVQATTDTHNSVRQLIAEKDQTIAEKNQMIERLIQVSKDLITEVEKRDTRIAQLEKGNETL